MRIQPCLHRVFIALAEMRRAPGRFALLVGAVALLVLLLLFFQTVAGALTSGLTGAFEANRADVFVYSDRARLNPFASVVTADAADAVAGVDGVQEATPVGVSVFTASTDVGDTDIAIVGGDPDGPASPQDVEEGRRPEAPDEALFSGSSLDSAFAVGDTVQVGDRTLTVVGTSSDAALNVLPTFYVPLETFTEAVRARAGASIDVPVSWIGVTVEDGGDATAVATAITEGVEGLEAVDRATATDAIPGVGQITRSFSILYLLLYIVVTIVTGVFFLILTVQKTEALVLLRAIGGSRGDVVKPVLLQAVAVVGLGSVLGVLATSGLLSVTRDVFGSTLSTGTTLTSVGAIVVLGLLASVGAVRRVLAIDPIDATTGGVA